MMKYTDEHVKKAAKLWWVSMKDLQGWCQQVKSSCDNIISHGTCTIRSAAAGFDN